MNATTSTPKGEMTLIQRWIYLGVALGCAFFARFVPLPQTLRTVGDLTLSLQGQTALGILLFALVLWMTEALPFHITGLLGIFLIAVFGVEDFSVTVRLGFGNHIFVFFIGVLILSSFITRSGFGKRISVFLLSRTGNSTGMIIFAFLVVGMVLSMWITNIAVAAMLMPLGVAILEEEGVTPLKSAFGKALMIACAWGPIVGGIMAPSGAGPNPLAIGFMREMAGIELTFLGWMMYGVPAGLLILVPTWFVLMLFFKPEISHLTRTKEDLRAEYDALPGPGREEKVTMVRLRPHRCALDLHPFVGKSLGNRHPHLDAGPPHRGALLLPRCRRDGVEDRRGKRFSWHSVILIVSGISLGMVLYRTGAGGVARGCSSSAVSAAYTPSSWSSRSCSW